MKDRLLIASTAKRLRETGGYDAMLTTVTDMVKAHRALRDVPEKLEQHRLNTYGVRSYVDLLVDFIPETDVMWPVYIVFVDAVTNKDGNVTNESLDSFYTLPLTEQTTILAAIMLCVRRRDSNVSFSETCLWHRFRLEAADTLKVRPTELDVARTLDLLLGKDPHFLGVFLGSIMSIAQVHMPRPKEVVSYFIPGIDIDESDPTDQQLCEAFNTLPEVERVAALHFCECYWSRAAQAHFEAAMRQS